MCAKALLDATEAGRSDGRRRDRYGGDCPHDHGEAGLRAAWFRGFSEGRAAAAPPPASPPPPAIPDARQQAGGFVVG